MPYGLPLALAAALVLAGCSRRHDPPPVPSPTPVASPTPAPTPVVSPSVAHSPTPSPVATPSPTAGYVVPPATRVVSPSGSPTSDCRPATPCKTIARAAEVATAGDVVVIEPGTYAGAVTVKGSGTRAAPILFVARTKGSVIVTGSLKPNLGVHQHLEKVTANPWVTWRGLVLRQFSSGPGSASDDCHAGVFAVYASDGWALEDMVLEQGQSGVRVAGHDVRIDRTTFQDLHRYALAGARADRTHVRDSVIRRINTGGALKPACGAVTKLLFSNGALIERNESYENVGPGFWLDWDNKNFVIRDNHFHHNKGRTAWWEGPGLWLEGNPAANGKVHGNTFAHNTGAGLGLLESVGVEVYDNTFDGNRVGIELRNIRRGASRILRNLSIHDNTFANWGVNGALGTSGTGGPDWANWSPATHNIRIDGNTYRPRPGQAIIRWLGRGYTTLAEIRSSLGFEATGTVQP